MSIGSLPAVSTALWKSFSEKRSPSACRAFSRSSISRMETVDQIEAREHAVRDRAWRYQRILGEVERCKRAIKRLTPSVAAYAATLDTLTWIEQLAAQPARRRARDDVPYRA